MAFPLAAVAVGGLLGALGAGKKPKVPKFVNVDPDAEQKSSIAGNMANFGGAEALADRTNAYSQDALMKALRQAVPGYDDMVSGSSSVIQEQLEGRLDQGTQDQIARTAAARSLKGGFSGSGMARNMELRDIGMTSYQATQQGLANSMNFLRNQAGIAMAPRMDITSMFFTPQQRLAHSVGERNLQFQRDMSAAQIAAQPNPMMAGIINGAAGAFGMAGGGLAGGIGGMLGGIGGKISDAWTNFGMNNYINSNSGMNNKTFQGTPGVKPGGLPEGQAYI